MSARTTEIIQEVLSMTPEERAELVDKMRLQQNNRIVSLAARCWSGSLARHWLSFGRLKVFGAGFAIKPEMLHPILALITIQRLAHQT